ncbi:MAG: general secretion pathway protein GspK [Verrucomicrobiota bacterium]|nr:general secretion pathway protein GspK [Verrucomicrobiota bacterium]
MQHPTAKSRSGAALMLALWALFLLSAMVIAWALDIDSRLGLSGNASRVVEAEAMASSGAEVALSPSVEVGSSVLHGSLGKNQSYDARIMGEGGRLNLNWLLAGESPQRLEILRKYLEVKGVDLNERDRMIDSLLDYVDPNDLARLNGAESEEGYQPKNSLLQRIEELKLVKAWEKFTAARDWDADITLFSTGPIDLTWASRDVLLSLPGFNEPIADRFLEYRRGPDGSDGTEDDPVFESLDQVRLALGFTPEQFAQLSGLIGFKDQVVRVVSVGKSGNVTRTVQMIIRKSATPQMIRWKEF